MKYPRFRFFNTGISFVVCFFLSSKGGRFAHCGFAPQLFLHIKDTWLPTLTLSTSLISTKC